MYINLQPFSKLATFVLALAPATGPIFATRDLSCTLFEYGVPVSVYGIPSHCILETPTIPSAVSDYVLPQAVGPLSPSPAHVLGTSVIEDCPPATPTAIPDVASFDKESLDVPEGPKDRAYLLTVALSAIVILAFALLYCVSIMARQAARIRSLSGSMKEDEHNHKVHTESMLSDHRLTLEEITRLRRSLLALEMEVDNLRIERDDLSRKNAAHVQELLEYKSQLATTSNASFLDHSARFEIPDTSRIVDQVSPFDHSLSIGSGLEDASYLDIESVSRILDQLPPFDGDSTFYSIAGDSSFFEVASVSRIVQQLPPFDVDEDSEIDPYDGPILDNDILFPRR